MKLNRKTQLIAAGLLSSVLATCYGLSKPSEIQPEGLPCSGGEKTDYALSSFLLTPRGGLNVWVSENKRFIGEYSGFVIEYSGDKSIISFPPEINPGEWSAISAQRPRLTIFDRTRKSSIYANPRQARITAEEYCFTEVLDGQVYQRSAERR